MNATTLCPIGTPLRVGRVLPRPALTPRGLRRLTCRQGEIGRVVDRQPPTEFNEPIYQLEFADGVEPVWISASEVEAVH
jgi:hypothetical protein